MMEDFNFCGDCKKNTIVAFDHSSGDTICTECGLVLESHYIDEVSEWRIFSDGGSNKDPNRVGESSNILSDIGINLSTFISASKGSKNDILKLHIREQDPDKALFAGFGAINTMADRLNVVEAIRARANEILTKMEEQKCRTEKNQQALSAACLFIACRENKLPRTLKEICSATCGLSMKDVNKGAQLIRRQLGLDMGVTDTSELVRRFCYNLGMKNNAMKAVQEALEKSEEIDVRRNPKSLLAAIICIITQLSDEKKPIEVISKACEVQEQTIRKSFKDVYPYASRLVPKWYASEQDITRNLRCP